jgi:hypothetical protein
VSDEEREKPEEGGEGGDPASELAEELSKPVPEEEEEGQTFELSPEQAEKLRPMARIQEVLSPKLDFKPLDVLGKSAFLRNYADIAKLGRFILPQATFNLTGISRMAADMNKFGRLNLPNWVLKGGRGPDFTSSALSSLMPALSIEPSWMKQMKLINSDVYKLSGLGQSNLTTLSSILTKNLDFGFEKTAAKLAAQFATQQTSWLNTIGPLLARLNTSFYPSNLQDIEDLEFEEVEAVVMLDGIALYGLPRQELTEKLIRAETTAARRAILGRRWRAISADCRAAVDACNSSTVAPYVSFAVAALDALDGEHTEAAQALAASLLDTVVNGYFGKQRFDLTPNRKTTTPAEYEKFTLREFIVFAPIWQAYQKYKTEDGDPIPNTFSRHASVHGVSARQFSRRNAVQAVLFVSSLLLFLDEEALALEAA